MNVLLDTSVNLERSRTGFSAAVVDAKSKKQEMMSGKMWEQLPLELRKHLEESPDINVEAGIEYDSIGITGAYEAVREMIAADTIAKGMCRQGYELWQGLDDFGFDMNQDNWRKPSIIQVKNGNSSKWDGRQSFVDCSEIKFINTNRLKRDAVLNLDSDASSYVGIAKRRGGFGQGLKVALTAAVANLGDRINCLQLCLDLDRMRHDNQLIAESIDALKRRQVEMQETPAVETFATVQAVDENGQYYRAYCYRSPYKSNNLDLWKLRFAVVSLDKSKIASDELNQVIVSIHNPDFVQAEILDQMPENFPCLNPHYNDPHNLVRPETDPLQAMDVDSLDLTYEPKLFDRSADWGNVQVVRMKDPYPEGNAPFFVSDVRFIPDTSIKTIFPYNLNPVDPVSQNVFRRSSNSTRMSGPVGEVIRRAVGEMRDAEGWEALFRAYSSHDLSQLGPEDKDEFTTLWPEFSPERTLGKLVDPTVRSAVRVGVESVWPNSDNNVASSQAEAELWSQIVGKADAPAIVPTRDMLRWLVDCDFSPVRPAVEQYVDDHSNLSMANLHTESIDDTVEVIRQREDLNRGFDELFKDFFGEGDGLLNYFEDAESYYLSADNGQHVLVLKGNYIFGNQLNDSLIAFNDPKVEMSEMQKEFLGLLVAAEQEGLRIDIEGNYSVPSAAIRKMKSGNWRTLMGSPRRSGTVRNAILIYGKLDKLTQLQKIMDSAAKVNHPELLSHGDSSEFQTMKDTLEFLLRKSEDEAKPADTMTVAEVKKLMTEVEEKAAAAERTMQAVQGELRARLAATGEINAAAVLGNFPDGSSPSPFFTKDTMLGRSSKAVVISSTAYEQQIVRSQELREDQAEIGAIFRNPDYELTIYDGEMPDMHPLESYEQIIVADGKIVASNRINLLVGAESESMWQGYKPDEGPGYIVRTSDGVKLYDGILSTNKEITPATLEHVLPIDALNYEIAFIQLPIESDDQLNPPFLMLDEINHSYHMIFQDPTKRGDGMKSLPAGSRIYFKRRSAQPDAWHESKMMTRTETSTYYRSLLKTTINENHLDDEARVCLDAMRHRIPPLSREQKMLALHKFWEKRRLYDKEGIKASSVEELILSGKGVCLEAAVAMLDMARYIGVPCRLRAGYPDTSKLGQLTLPLHGVLEFFDSKGYIKRWDPPNSRMTENYAQKLANMSSRELGIAIHDASSLTRVNPKDDMEIDLPEDIIAAIATVETRPGHEINDRTRNVLSRVVRGYEVGGDDIVRSIFINEATEVDNPEPRQTTNSESSIAQFLLEVILQGINVKKVGGISGLKRKKLELEIGSRILSYLLNYE